MYCRKCQDDLSDDEVIHCECCGKEHCATHHTMKLTEDDVYLCERCYKGLINDTN